MAAIPPLVSHYTNFLTMQSTIFTNIKQIGELNKTPEPSIERLYNLSFDGVNKVKIRVDDCPAPLFIRNICAKKYAASPGP